MNTDLSSPFQDNLTVAQIALACPEALEVLNRYHLDYCCGGRERFVDACESVGLDPEQIWGELQASRITHQLENTMHFRELDVPVLLDFIVQHHHKYVRSSMPLIEQLLNKICVVHGETNPYLFKVREVFSRLSQELTSHMIKEEQSLFPAIRESFTHQKENYYNGNIHFNSKELVDNAKQEHELAGELVKSIRSLTTNFHPPVYACPTFKACYAQLSEFDKDLMQHIHLENNILFAKSQGD